MDASNSKTNSDPNQDPIPSESPSPELSPSSEHFKSAAVNEDKTTSQPTGVRKDKQKGARKRNTRGVKVKDLKQPHNERKNRNLNVMRKIISTFKRTSDNKKDVSKNPAAEGLVESRENEKPNTSPSAESHQPAPVTSPPDFNYKLQAPLEEETDEELEEEDQSDSDNIDTENIRVPLKTIAINELLFPHGRFGRKWSNQKRKKNSEMDPKPSNTSTSTKTTVDDPNLPSVTSYYDWDDGLDTLSVRTEDIFTNGGELVPNFNARNLPDNSSTCRDTEQALSATSSGIAATSFSKSKMSKLQSYQAPIRVIHSHVITPFRLNKTNWNVAYENLTIRKCVENIQPEKLTLSIPTLTSLKFAQLSSFQVISCCLQSFHNLKRLCFSNVALVQKKNYNENDPHMINLPNVTELEMIQWISSLTKYEYWLLEVFTRSVHFGKLESFTFRGADFVVGEKSLAKCQKLLESIRDTAVVVRFVVKNRSSLRKISFGGVGFKMMEHYQGVTLEPELGKVTHITDFRINLSTFGIDLLLMNQRQIQSLTFTGYVTDFEVSYTNLVRRCIDSNRVTLSSLGIFPCIVGDGSRPFYGSLTPFIFNCGIFETCQNLKSLFLNITTAQKMFTKRFSCGKVTNLHLLPKNLCTIEIYNHDFDSADLEKFGQNFYRYRSLHRLVLSSITANKYVLRVEWIKYLFALPNFERVDFFGGKLESGRLFREYITSKPPGFITMIQISDCISFYKPSLYPVDDEHKDIDMTNVVIRSHTGSASSSRRARARSDNEERTKTSL